MPTATHASETRLPMCSIYALHASQTPKAVAIYALHASQTPKAVVIPCGWVVARLASLKPQSLKVVNQGGRVLAKRPSIDGGAAPLQQQQLVKGLKDLCVWLVDCAHLPQHTAGCQAQSNTGFVQSYNSIKSLCSMLAVT